MRSRAIEEDLQAAVYADPVSDAPRIVYSDWLQERGDPRGEVIALQLACNARKLTAEEAHRLKELIVTFGDGWLGPLAPVLDKKGIGFDRGFVAFAAVTSNMINHPELEAHPAWAPFIELRKTIPSLAVEMPLLRAVTHIGNRDVIRIAERKTSLPALERISWNGPIGFAYEESTFDADAQVAIRAFTKIDCVPALKCLEMKGEHSWPADHWLRASTRGIRPEHLRWAWSSRASTQLEELLFPAPLRYLPRFLDAITPTSIRRLFLNSNGEVSYRLGIVSSVRRNKKTGAFTLLDIHYRSERCNLSSYISEFEQLPRDLFTHIRLIASERVWENFNDKMRLREVMERQQGLNSFSVVQPTRNLAAAHHFP